MVPLRTDQSRKQIEEWSLVLSASSIPYIIEEKNGKWVISVDVSNIDRSEQILRAYHEENRDWLPEVKEKPVYGKSFSGFGMALLLMGIYLAMKWQKVDVKWFQLGCASAEHILGGEWWRAVTALFLHGDILHVLLNSICCWIFCSAVCRFYGFGLGWFLILAAGVGGNIITAFVFKANHYSIGASTAIFGAAGLLGAWRFAFRRKHPIFRKKAWIPLAGVLALLAFLGVGKNADLTAHFSGGIMGCFLGMLAARGITHPIPKKWQLLLAALSAAIVLISWFFAVGMGG